MIVSGNLITENKCIIFFLEQFLILKENMSAFSVILELA